MSNKKDLKSLWPLGALFICGLFLGSILGQMIALDSYHSAFRDANISICKVEQLDYIKIYSEYKACAKKLELAYPYGFTINLSGLNNDNNN